MSRGARHPERPDVTSTREPAQGSGQSDSRRYAVPRPGRRGLGAGVDRWESLPVSAALLADTVTHQVGAAFICVAAA